MIFSTELLSSSSPTVMMINDTTSPAIYSARPCPKGCSLSGFCPAMRKPAMVITELPASERLLKASATTAMEPVIMPAASLQTQSTALRNIPTPPQSMPYLRRTSGFSVSFAFFMNMRESRAIML